MRLKEVEISNQKLRLEGEKLDVEKEKLKLFVQRVNISKQTRNFGHQLNYKYTENNIKKLNYNKGLPPKTLYRNKRSYSN